MIRTWKEELSATDLKILKNTAKAMSFIRRKNYEFGGTVVVICNSAAFLLLQKRKNAATKHTHPIFVRVRVHSGIGIPFFVNEDSRVYLCLTITSLCANLFYRSKD